VVSDNAYQATLMKCWLADLTITSQQLEAFNYYKKNTMSIEILKDDHLQKVNFRVKNKVSLKAVNSHRGAIAEKPRDAVLCMAKVVTEAGKGEESSINQSSYFKVA